MISMKSNLATLALAFMAFTAAAHDMGVVTIYSQKGCVSNGTDFTTHEYTSSNSCLPATNASIIPADPGGFSIYILDPAKATTCYIWNTTPAQPCGVPGSQQAVAESNVCTTVEPAPAIKCFQCFRGIC
jgi:hypothetical protein